MRPRVAADSVGGGTGTAAGLRIITMSLSERVLVVLALTVPLAAWADSGRVCCNALTIAYYKLSFLNKSKRHWTLQLKLENLRMIRH